VGVAARAITRLISALIMPRQRGGAVIDAVASSTKIIGSLTESIRSRLTLSED
jgi:hypothetical protein